MPVLLFQVITHVRGATCRLHWHSLEQAISQPGNNSKCCGSRFNPCHDKNKTCCAGRGHASSEMVQPLDARISQPEEVNWVTSYMLIARRYNYLLHILSAIFWGFSRYMENCQTCGENPWRWLRVDICDKWLEILCMMSHIFYLADDEN
jgi:hypothetical protein